MKKIGKIIILFGILIVGGIAAYYTGLFTNLSETLRDRFQPVEEEGVIVVSGNVEITEVDVGFTLPGRIEKLMAIEGQEVKQGDLLAVLEHAELASVVEQTQAALSEARVMLKEIKTGARSQEIEEAKANVSAVEAELNRAQKDFQRAESLYNDNLIPASQLDAARSVYNAATARHQQALERLSLMQAGATGNAINAAEFRVQQAESALQAAEERMNNTRILAPLDGVILEKNAEIGEIIAQGSPVYTVGDLINPWIKVYIKEDKLGQIKLGQQAEVSIDSFPDKVYTGTITHIASQAEFTPKNVQTREERVKLVFEVKVNVKNINDELKPGMPADVRILLDE